MPALGVVVGRLDGKVAIVTGAGGGIGREHALLLAEEGARVLVNDIGLRAGADAAKVASEITGLGGTAVANATSATWDGAASIVAAALESFGRIDILINNATAGRNNDLWRFTEDDWDLTFAVNLKGYFAMIRSAAPYLCRQGSGAIVNTSSGSGFGHPSHVAYASAKEGVVGLTRTVARELGRFGVRCNAIRPLAAGQSTKDYAVKTARWTTLMELTMGSRAGRTQPQVFDPDAIAPRKIAPMVVWLCTDAASNVNGRSFHVSGDTVSRLTEPQRERVIQRSGGWDLDALDATAPTHLVDDPTRSNAIASAAGWKLPLETIARRSARTTGLSPVEFSSVSTVPRAKNSASRQAPCTWVVQRRLNGLCIRRRGAPSHKELSRPAASASAPPTRAARSKAGSCAPPLGGDITVVGLEGERRSKVGAHQRVEGIGEHQCPVSDRRRVAAAERQCVLPRKLHGL